MDAETRLKNKVVGLGAVLLVGFVIYANSGGNGPAARDEAASKDFQPVTAPAEPVAPPKDVTPPAILPSPPIISSARAAVVNPVPAGAPQPAGPARLPSWKSAAALHWKHTTNGGTRWSLRQLRGTAMALLIDLGDDQVATVLVTPEFQKLDLAGMDRRVEYVRSEVMKVTAFSAAYSYSRNGTVSPYP